MGGELEWHSVAGAAFQTEWRGVVLWIQDAIARRPVAGFQCTEMPMRAGVVHIAVFNTIADSSKSGPR